MDLYTWLTGLFFIVCGLLVKKFPGLIAGYNTLKKEQKANVDIKGLSGFLCNWFIILGCLQIALFYLCRVTGLEDIAITVMSVVTFLILIYMFVNAQKFDHNKHNKLQLLFIITFLLIVAGCVIYNIISDSQTAEITLAEGKISIDGSYGVSKPVQDIKNISLTDSLPEISFRSNGLAIGSIRKGHFRLKNGETCTLFIVSGNSPYIRITPLTGETIYINLDTPEDTREKYKELNEALLKESVRQ